jgi:hypothetical protein
MPGENDDTSETGLGEASATCLRYVEQYRARQITFSAAVGGISKTLVAEGANSSDLDGAISAYVDSLKEVDRDREEAMERGRKMLPGFTDEGGGCRLDIRAFRSVARGRSASPTLRQWHRERDDGDIGGVDRTGGGDPGFAWLWDNISREPVWHPSFSPIEQAHELVVAYEKDAKATIWSIIACKRRPNFPAGHWRDIIGGQYVDLDKLREDAHSHAMGKPNRFELGDGVKILLPGASNAPKTKTIVDFNTWDDAWERYFDAVVFAFPMRERELKSYCQWLRRQFQAVTVPARVIGLDRAIRKEAGDGAMVALDNFHDWYGLMTQYLSSFGTGESYGEGNS